MPPAVPPSSDAFWSSLVNEGLDQSPPQPVDVDPHDLNFPLEYIWESTPDHPYEYDVSRPTAPSSAESCKSGSASSAYSGSSRSASSLYSGSASSQYSGLKKSVLNPNEHQSSYNHSREERSRFHCTVKGCTTSRFWRKTDLNRHIATVHGNKKFDCPYEWCGRKGDNGFTRIDHWREHMREWHRTGIPTHFRKHQLNHVYSGKLNHSDSVAVNEEDERSNTDTVQSIREATSISRKNESDRLDEDGRRAVESEHPEIPLIIQVPDSSEMSKEPPFNHQFPILAWPGRFIESSALISDDQTSISTTSEGSSTNRSEESQSSTEDHVLEVSTTVLVHAYLGLAFKRSRPTGKEQHDGESSHRHEKDCEQQGTAQASQTSQRNGKRKQSKSGDDQTGNDKSRKGSKRQRAETGTGMKTYERPLACPFNKYDNRLFGPDSPDEAYRTCAACSFISIAHLKQHLQRTHYLPQHFCYRCCRRNFSSQAMVAEHLRQEPICEKLEPPLYAERIGPDLIEELGLDRKNPAGTDRVEYWYRIYKTFFPGVSESQLPSPYFEGPAADHLNRFLHFSAHVLDELIPVVRSRLGLIGELSPNNLSHLIQDVQQQAGQEFLQSTSSTSMPRLGQLPTSPPNNACNHPRVEHMSATSQTGSSEGVSDGIQPEQLTEQGESLAIASRISSNSLNPSLSSGASASSDSNLPQDFQNTLQSTRHNQDGLLGTSTLLPYHDRSDFEELSTLLYEMPDESFTDGLDWETEVNKFFQSRADFPEPSADV